jgi:hypothetical protein
MKYLHTETNTTYEIGRLFDTDGKTYDINVITKWDEEHDFEQSPVIVDYYFGDLEDDTTDCCIETFLKRQKYLKSSLKYLEGKLMVDEEYMEPEEIDELKQSIECIKEMIITF